MDVFTFEEQIDLLNLAHDYIVIRDMENKILYINSSVERDYGWSLNEVYGQNIIELFQTKFPDCFEVSHAILLDTGVWEGELIHKDSKGKEVVVQSSQSVKYGKNNQPEFILGIDRNITQYKKMEKELRRLSQFDIIGEMAAGIGHEVRNPMTTVRGYLQMFHKREIFSGYKEQLETAIEEIDRANSVISEFLSLAKDKLVNMDSGNLNEVITRLSPLIQADALLRGHTVKIEANDIPNIIFDSNEMKKLILNLVRNAIEAMKENGLVTIKTNQIDNEVVLSIQDNGSGIPNAILENVGMPFYTTKENGTGLGLSICYRIIHEHNATIDIDTSPQGTTFFIRFKIT